MIEPLHRHNKMLRKTPIVSKHQEIRSSCYYVLLIISIQKNYSKFRCRYPHVSRDADLLLLYTALVYSIIFFQNNRQRWIISDVLSYFCFTVFCVQGNVTHLKRLLNNFSVRVAPVTSANHIKNKLASEADLGLLQHPRLSSSRRSVSGHSL